MKSLQQTLDSISAAGAKSMPRAKFDVMHRATEQLAASGQAERATGAGDIAASFELADSQGNLVRSHDLLAKGPLVLTFFRGHW